MPTQKDIQQAIENAGVKKGDILMIHSSFKSLGPVEGGAEAVIAGALDAVGPEGTLVFPTFCQKDFDNSYETWHIGKPSDTGYLTEYFRTRPGSLRSDQATHSVAACGPKAQWLTETHGHTHKRYGNMGDTPFSADSPFAKMYENNAKVLMLGVKPHFTTFRHFAEYVYVESCLQKISDPAKRQQMQSRLASMTDDYAAWPRIYNVWIFDRLLEQGKVRVTWCGKATLLCYNAKDFVDLCLYHLENRTQEALFDHKGEIVARWNQWLKDLDEIVAAQ